MYTAGCLNWVAVMSRRSVSTSTQQWEPGPLPSKPPITKTAAMPRRRRSLARARAAMLHAPAMSGSQKHGSGLTGLRQPARGCSAEICSSASRAARVTVSTCASTTKTGAMVIPVTITLVVIRPASFVQRRTTGPNAHLQLTRVQAPPVDALPLLRAAHAYIPTRCTVRPLSAAARKRPVRVPAHRRLRCENLQVLRPPAFDTVLRTPDSARTSTLFHDDSLTRPRLNSGATV